jgi:hypothetical protein
MQPDEFEDEPREEEPVERDLSDEKLVRIFDATSEVEALAIQSMLQHEGMEAAVRSLQMPWCDGIAQAMNPVWGIVLVRESCESDARRLIADFMYAIESTPEDIPPGAVEEPWEDAEHQEDE